MSIETYARAIAYFHLGLFFFLIVIGFVAIWRRIRKKTIKYWWLIPYVICYSIFAFFGTSIAAIAYDDISDPNYWKYKNWRLLDFVLNDIKRLIIWLVIGVLLYFAFERKGCKRSIKNRRAL